MKCMKTWGKYRDCVGEIRNERLAETRVGMGRLDDKNKYLADIAGDTYNCMAPNKRVQVN